MKDTTTLLVLILATIATGVIAAVAEGAPAATPSTVGEIDPIVVTDNGPGAAVRRHYDIDGDGFLDASERAAMRADIVSGDFLEVALATLPLPNDTLNRVAPSNESE